VIKRKSPYRDVFRAAQELRHADRVSGRIRPNLYNRIVIAMGWDPEEYVGAMFRVHAGNMTLQ